MTKNFLQRLLHKLSRPKNANNELMDFFDAYLLWRTHDAELASWRLATEDTARYITQSMHSARIFKGAKMENPYFDKDGRNALLEFALSCARNDGLFMEFGVFQGETINFIADHIDGIVHGFDSFEGLPDDWFLGRKAGRFSLQGKEPPVWDNVRLHKGWFKDTLPVFLDKNDQPVRFVHIDCDVYSSAKTVLDLLRPRLAAGSVLVFDEYFNYPGWQMHEFKAFQEFVADSRLQYEYLGMAPLHFSVAILLK